MFPPTPARWADGRVCGKKMMDVYENQDALGDNITYCCTSLSLSRALVCKSPRRVRNGISWTLPGRQAYAIVTLFIHGRSTPPMTTKSNLRLLAGWTWGRTFPSADDFRCDHMHRTVFAGATSKANINLYRLSFTCQSRRPVLPCSLLKLL